MSIVLPIWPLRARSRPAPRPYSRRSLPLRSPPVASQPATTSAGRPRRAPHYPRHRRYPARRPPRRLRLGEGADARARSICAGRRPLHRRGDTGPAHAAGACDDPHRPAPGEARRPHERRVPAGGRRADAGRGAARPRLRDRRVHRRLSAAGLVRSRVADSIATTTTSFARRGPWNVRRTKSSARRSRGSTQHRSQPFFAWLHLFDPHSPYAPPAPFAAAHARAPYDGEVAYTDAAIGRLFEHLQRSGLFSRAAILIVADHGESLGEHGERTHGTFLYDATVRVPLLVKLPDMAAAREVSVPVETADLAPTIASIAGAALGAVDGQSLLPLLHPARLPQPAIRIGRRTPSRYYQNVLLGWSPLRAVRTSRWKFIEAPRPELYDLERDPGELRNRVDDRAALAGGLQRALPSSALTRARRPGATAAGESAERLRSLGYVSGSTTAFARHARRRSERSRRGVGRDRRRDRPRRRATRAARSRRSRARCGSIPATASR